MTERLGAAAAVARSMCKGDVRVGVITAHGDGYEVIHRPVVPSYLSAAQMAAPPITLRKHFKENHCTTRGPFGKRSPLLVLGHDRRFPLLVVPLRDHSLSLPHPFAVLAAVRVRVRARYLRIALPTLASSARHPLTIRSGVRPLLSPTRFAFLGRLRSDTCQPPLSLDRLVLRVPLTPTGRRRTLVFAHLLHRHVLQALARTVHRQILDRVEVAWR